MKLTYITFIFLFASCITQQKCAERFPPKETDSVKTEIRYIPDTAHKDVPKKEFGFTVKVPGIDPSINYHKEEKKGNATAIVDISKGKIKVTCREDAYKATIAYLRKQITTIEKHTKVSPPKIEYRDHWDVKPLRWFFFIVMSLAVGFAAGKWFKVF